MSGTARSREALLVEAAGAVAGQGIRSHASRGVFAASSLVGPGSKLHLNSLSKGHHLSLAKQGINPNSGLPDRAWCIYWIRLVNTNITKTPGEVDTLYFFTTSLLPLQACPGYSSVLFPQEIDAFNSVL